MNVSDEFFFSYILFRLLNVSWNCHVCNTFYFSYLIWLESLNYSPPKNFYCLSVLGWKNVEEIENKKSLEQNVSQALHNFARCFMSATFKELREKKVRK